MPSIGLTNPVKKLIFPKVLLLSLNLNFAMFSEMESSPVCLGKNYFYEGFISLCYNPCKKIKIFISFRVMIFKTQNIANLLNTSVYKNVH